MTEKTEVKKVTKPQVEVKEEKKEEIPRIMICVPTYRNIDTDVVNALLNDVDFSGLKVQILFTKHLSAAEARNKFIKVCQENKSRPDYIWFVDSDTLPDKYSLKRLLSDNKDIVSGLYFRRGWPYPPLIMLENPKVEGRYNFLAEYPQNSLVECDAIGLGNCLIKMEVFDKVEYPWFAQIGSNTEDVYFCKKAKEKGYKVFVDTGTKSKHIGEIQIDEETFAQAKRDILLMKKVDSKDEIYGELDMILKKTPLKKKTS